MNVFRAISKLKNSPASCIGAGGFQSNEKSGIKQTEGCRGQTEIERSVQALG